MPYVQSRQFGRLSISGSPNRSPSSSLGGSPNRRGNLIIGTIDPEFNPAGDNSDRNLDDHVLGGGESEASVASSSTAVDSPVISEMNLSETARKVRHSMTSLTGIEFPSRRLAQDLRDR